jgi:hypothetical protein
MKKSFNFVLHLMLMLVILSEARSIWIGIAERTRYLAVFPGAIGALYYLTLAMSFAAGLNCVMIWLKKRWAVWLNILIGLCSISLIEIVQGPRINEWIVLFACATTSVLPLALWGLRGRNRVRPKHFQRG